MRYLLVALLSLTACGVESAEDAASWDAPEADEAEALRVAPRYGGCGDTTMYAANANDTTAIFFQLSGLVQRVQAAGHPMRFSVALPHPAVGVSYQEGRRLTSATCVGMPPFPGPTVNQTYDISGGQLDVVATPTAGGGADVQLSLQSPTFVQVGPGGGVGFAIRGSIDIPTTGVGFYPP